MQLLAFTIGAEEYAIEAHRVIEVLPLVTARPIPRMPDFVRGIFTHRGRLVPLVDLGRLLTDTPLRARLGTRVIVVEFSSGDDSSAPHAIRLGAAAENVLSLCSSTGAEPSLPALHPPHAPYLGRLVRIGGRTLQVLNVEHLLPASLLGHLVAPTPASTDGKFRP
jgi:chemotaxis-related protein WspB